MVNSTDPDQTQRYVAYDIQTMDIIICHFVTLPFKSMDFYIFWKNSPNYLIEAPEIYTWLKQTDIYNKQIILLIFF